MDIVERLRKDPPKHKPVIEAAAEIERLRSLLQSGSPVVEATIQHQAMEIMKLKQQVAELRSAIEEIHKGASGQGAFVGMSWTQVLHITREALARTAKEE